MDIPLYLRVLRRYWTLLVVGVLVAVAAGIFSGYSVSSAGLTSRASASYAATTTLQLNDPSISPFASEVTPEVTTENGETVLAQPDRQSLTQLAILYAYYVVSDDVRAQTTAVTGPLATDERVTAASRTTQPSGSEAFPGRFTLPLLDVVAYGATPERATELSTVTASTFLTYVTAMQDAQSVPADQRIEVTTVRTTAPVAQDSSNPLLPVLLVSFAVLVAFVGLAFVLQNISDHRGPRTEGRRRATRGPEPDASGRGDQGRGDQGRGDQGRGDQGLQDDLFGPDRERLPSPSPTAGRSR